MSVGPPFSHSWMWWISQRCMGAPHATQPRSRTAMARCWWALASRMLRPIHRGRPRPAKIMPVRRVSGDSWARMPGGTGPVPMISQRPWGLVPSSTPMSATATNWADDLALNPLPPPPAADSNGLRVRASRPVMSSNSASARRCSLVRTSLGRPSRPPSARHRASVWPSTTCSIRLKLIGSKAPKTLPMPVSESTKTDAARAPALAFQQGFSAVWRCGGREPAGLAGEGLRRRLLGSFQQIGVAVDDRRCRTVRPRSPGRRRGPWLCRPRPGVRLCWAFRPAVQPLCRPGGHPAPTAARCPATSRPRRHCCWPGPLRRRSDT